MNPNTLTPLSFGTGHRRTIELREAMYYYISHCMAANGRPPTLRGIARHFKLARPDAALYHVNVLARVGTLRKVVIGSTGKRHTFEVVV
jgi:SOS-response transcriptional repressor LexA